jgi:hypothetical protein
MKAGKGGSSASSVPIMVGGVQKYLTTTVNKYNYPNAEREVCLTNMHGHYRVCIRSKNHKYYSATDLIVPVREQLYRLSVQKNVKLKHFLIKPTFDEMRYENEYLTENQNGVVVYKKIRYLPAPGVLLPRLVQKDVIVNEEDWEDGNGDNYDENTFEEYGDCVQESENHMNGYNDELEEECDFDSFIPSVQVPAMNPLYDPTSKFSNRFHRHYIGNLHEGDHHVCEHCGALHFCGEELSSSKNGHYYYSECCNDGLHIPPPVTNFPQFMKDLYEGKKMPALSKQFFELPIEYDTSCSFAATATSDPPKFKSLGPPVYKLCGDVRYTVAHPLASAEQSTNSKFHDGFSNFYLYDSAADVSEKRMKMSIWNEKNVVLN